MAMVKKRIRQNCQDRNVGDEPLQEVDHGKLNKEMYKEQILSNQMGRQRYLVKKSLNNRTERKRREHVRTNHLSYMPKMLGKDKFVEMKPPAARDNGMSDNLKSQAAANL